MDKLVGVAVLVLIVVSIWAVMPSTPTVVVTGTSNDARALGGSKDVDVLSTVKTLPVKRKAAEGKPSNNSATSNPSTSVNGESQRPGQNELPDMVDGEPINARVFSDNPVARKNKKDAPAEDSTLGPFANVHWDGETDYADLEGDLLKIYAQRDAQGRLPKNIVASQVLRASVLKDLNITSTTPVVMIGDYHPVHQDAITETLKRARKGQFLTGFTFADPTSTSDGRRVYVKVLQD
jgi:hypothetical protein